MDIIALVFLIMGVVFLCVGAVLIRSAPDSAKGFRRAEATVVDYSLGDTPDMIKPLVRFDADGEQVTRDMVTVSRDVVNAQPGDQITILWKKSTVLGMTAWEVLPENGITPDQRTGIVKWFGILFLGFGAVIMTIAVKRILTSTR